MAKMKDLFTYNYYDAFTIRKVA